MSQGRIWPPPDAGRPGWLGIAAVVRFVPAPSRIRFRPSYGRYLFSAFSRPSWFPALPESVVAEVDLANSGPYELLYVAEPNNSGTQFIRLVAEWGDGFQGRGLYCSLVGKWEEPQGTEYFETGVNWTIQEAPLNPWSLRKLTFWSQIGWGLGGPVWGSLTDWNVSGWPAPGTVPKQEVEQVSVNSLESWDGES